ncbi:MAG: hypothetical protein KDA60_14030, partial [Planctomycetales bacterium]|nr:hypothetical protein [Planctomycetales bacterium]
MSCRIELLTIFALSCLAGVGRAQSTSPVAETADNAIFVDEFDGQSLDRNKWNVVLTGFVYNREEQAYVDSTETVYISHEADAAGTDGVLVIHPRYRAGYETPEGRKFDFISGRINTRD